MAKRSFSVYTDSNAGGQSFVGPASAGYWKGVSFTEAGDTTYTGTIVIPADSLIVDIVLRNPVLWDDTGAVSLNVGDDDDADGYFAAVNLKATDFLVGEVLRMSNSEYWGGKQGAYLVAASGTATPIWYTSANNIIGVITAANGDGSAGRTRMWVNYVTLEQTVAATGS